MTDGDEFYPEGQVERDLEPKGIPEVRDEGTYGYRAEVRNVDRDATRDLRSLVAFDLPHPLQYAQCLNVTNPELARVILSASLKRNLGWRIRLDATDPALMALRSLGLVEVRGFEPSPASIAAGLGTHLSGYGREVMLALQSLRAVGNGGDTCSD